MKFSLKKVLLYILALVLLGTSVALIQQTRLGMSAWDALNRNFYEGIPIEYKYLTPIVALVLVALAYLIEWKKPHIIMLFPLLISFIIGTVIDLQILVIPIAETVANQIGLGYFWDILYLVIATFLVSIALNIIVYVAFPLPALDQFCMAIARRFHITFGQGKYIGEAIALVSAVIAGEFFGFRSQFYYLGYTTVYYVLVLGFIIDLVKYPLYRLLGAVTKIEMFADDMERGDIQKKSWRKTSRAIIIDNGKILLEHLSNEDFYILPGGGKERFETLENCLKREVLHETGYKIKEIDEKVVVMEYFLDATFENHYYVAKLKKNQIYENRIRLTEQEQKQGIELVWIELSEAITLLDEYDSKHEFGSHIMNREFLGIINSI